MPTKSRDSLGASDPTDQPSQLLATKLSLRAPRSKIVRRSRLTQVLRDGMQKRLTLVVAPAGYGKTTMVGEWLSSISTTGWSVASISLDEYDNNLLRFWSYVVAALQAIHPPVQYNIRKLWRSYYDQEDCTLLNPLLNEIAEIPRQFSLILDDYHEITEPAIQRTMAYLLEHLPPNCHLTLISRVMPPLPISRLRARGQLAEVTAPDLCFTLEETATFLSAVMDLDIPWDEVVSLKDLTEGWITGLKLSALSLKGQHDAKGLIASFTGGYRHILDYLTDEVLNRQEEAVKDFLLKTSILSELSAPLCDAILGRKDSQKMLDILEQANLFIVPLDSRRRWYRYHPLFADLLQMRLIQIDLELASQLNLAAYEWLRKNGFPEKSISYALAAGETELAADTVEKYALNAIIAMDLATLMSWFGRLPESIVLVRPRLVVYSTLTNLIFGKADDLEDRLKTIEADLEKDHIQHIPQEEKERLRRYVDVVRAAAACTRGDVSGGIRSAQQVLESLQPEDFFFLGLVEHYLAYAYQAAGRLAQGAAVLNRACQNALRHHFHKEYVLSKSEQARFYRLQGRLHAAAEAYQEASDYASRYHLDPGVQLFPLAGIADIYREWDEIQESDRLLAEPIHHLSSSHSPLEWYYMIDVCLAIAKNRILHGEFNQAAALIQNARQLVQNYHSIPDLFDEIRAVNVLLLLAQGDLAAAISWAERKEREAQEQHGEINPTQRIAIARVHLAAGQPDKAGLLLSALLAELQGSEQGERWFEALILQAQVLWQAGRRAEAMQALDQAIAAAEPENRIRSFIDCGEPMKILLSYRLGMFENQPSAAKQNPGYAYVLRLIEHFKTRPQKAAPIEKPAPADPVILTGLTEPLSERELEVLNLLAKGYSYGEVARSLVISVNTTKAHIKSIYQKLDVHSRKEAIEMALSLNSFMAEA